MHWLDLAALGMIALSALAGLRRGFVVGAASLAGLGVGFVIGSRVVPGLIGQESSRYVPVISLVGALVGAFVVQMLFAFAGRRLRTLLMVVPPLKVLDHVLGFFLGALTAATLWWVIGAVMLYLPGQTGTRTAAQESAVLRALNNIVPPARVMRALSNADPLAVIVGPAADIPLAGPAAAATPGVQGARSSVVRVRGYACGLGVAGTGWIAAPELIVTAAHVVAGIDDPVVDHGEGTPEVSGQVVAFDKRNDVAVVRVDRIAGRPLQLADEPEGKEGAILGFPGNRAYTAVPARVGRDVTFLNRDAYGNFPVTRTVTLLRGMVEPGNSGGPVVSTIGEVLATVFGSRAQNDTNGFGVPNRLVRDLLAKAGATGLSTPCVGG